MRKIYLVTFGCKGKIYDFTNSAIRLKNQAISTGWFDDVFVFNNDNIGNHNHDMNTFGAGFGWWKARIVKMVFDKIDENDIVLYLDAGFSLNKNEIADNNFLRYITNCDSGPGFLGFIGFSHVNSEKEHTKRDVFKFMDCDTPKYTDSQQMASGAFFVKKNKFGKKLMDEFDYFCGIEHLINEYPSYYENYEEYNGHRHNQSVFSLLVKRRLPKLTYNLLDLYEIGDKYNNNQNYPFNASRIDDSQL
jgi:hypothetical protein